MDSYDEVHDVKNVRNIETPPDNSVVDLDLDVSSAIRFIQSEDDEKNLISNEVKYSFLLPMFVCDSLNVTHTQTCGCEFMCVYLYSCILTAISLILI